MANVASLGTVYVETTIPSYLVARPNRDLVVLSHQQITREWWDGPRHAYELHVSAVVLEEIRLGDPALARQREGFVDGLPLLSLDEEVEQLAEVYLRQLALPARAARDAVHLALAVRHTMDYLLTWNCAHLANAAVRRALRKLNGERGLHVPTICTPEELLGEREETQP